MNHAFCIHDFFQSEDAGIPKIGENVPAVKAGFLLFRGCAKGEIGEHKEYIGRAFLTLRKEIVEPGFTGDQNRLFRIHDKGCCTVEHGSGEQRMRRNHRGLRMAMRVDKGGDEGLSLAVYFLRTEKVAPDSCDISLLDSDISRIEGGSVSIKDGGVFKNAICGALFPAYFGKFTIEASVHSLLPEMHEKSSNISVTSYYYIGKRHYPEEFPSGGKIIF